TAGDAVALLRSEKRRSVLEAAALSPELRQNTAACRGIDQALASATAMKGRDRQETADTLAVAVLRWLSADARPIRTVLLRVVDEDRTVRQEPARAGRWRWITRHHPDRDRVIRDVAWDSDGQCLAVTNRGLSFWNGASFRDAPLEGIPRPDGI